MQSGPLRAVEELDDRLRDLPPDQAAVARSELALAHRELVDIAHGLYPQALIEHGLAGALSDMAARSPIPVTVDSPLPDAALPPRSRSPRTTSGARRLPTSRNMHAPALARPELSTSAGELLLRVVDDGVGGADPAGRGLSGLRDRVQTIDGRLHVRSPNGAGTVIEACIPIHETG